MRAYPFHCVTGAEDYSGRAGGEVPPRKVEFSAPFVAKGRVGIQAGFVSIAAARCGEMVTDFIISVPKSTFYHFVTDRATSR